MLISQIYLGKLRLRLSRSSTIANVNQILLRWQWSKTLTSVGKTVLRWQGSKTLTSVVSVIKIFFLLLLCNNFSLVAQNLPDSLLLSSAKDTLSVAKLLPSVAVIGSRPSDFAAGGKVLEIDPKLLKINLSNNLADVLANYAPAYLRNYGTGMLATVSFRGTSPNHTAVLWNGLNINHPSLGQTDFATLPLHSQTSVAFRLGAASANYGTAAVGGAVLLNTPLTFTKQKQVAFGQEIGSFGLNKTNFYALFANSKVALQTSFYQQSLQNDFAFSNRNKFGNPTEKQENAAIRQIGFTQDVGLKIGKASHLIVRAWYTDSYRQLQAPMGVAHHNANQTDQNFRAMAELVLPYRKTKTTIKTAFFHDNLVYANDNMTPSHSLVQTSQAQAEHTIQFRPHIALQLGADYQHFAAFVDGYGKNITENRASFFALFRYNLTYHLQLTANLRQAIVEGFNPPPTPSLGCNYQVLQRGNHLLTLKAHAALSYRVPTLNERFWQPGGNPNLKPEQGTSIETGFRHQWLHEKNQLTLLWTNEWTAYNNLINNWIQWKAGNSFWYPDNLLQVRARGIEGTSQLKIKTQTIETLLGVNYQYTQSIQTETQQPEEKDKQLAYVPLHTSNFFGLVTYKKISLNVNGTYIGSRFTLADNLESLPAYWLGNLAVGYQTNWQHLRTSKGNTKVAIWLKINNLTNAVYENVAFRAMPLRNYAVSLQVFF